MAAEVEAVATAMEVDEETKRPKCPMPDTRQMLPFKPRINARE